MTRASVAARADVLRGRVQPDHVVIQIPNGCYDADIRQQPRLHHQLAAGVPRALDSCSRVLARQVHGRAERAGRRGARVTSAPVMPPSATGKMA
jgi:hypothetical protein